jgi:hypothetical protein
VKYTDDDVAQVCYEATRAVRLIENRKILLLPWSLMTGNAREVFTDEIRRIRNGADADQLGETERKVIRGIVVALTF